MNFPWFVTYAPIEPLCDAVPPEFDDIVPVFVSSALSSSIIPAESLLLAVIIPLLFKLLAFKNILLLDNILLVFIMIKYRLTHYLLEFLKKLI